MAVKDEQREIQEVAVKLHSHWIRSKHEGYIDNKTTEALKTQTQSLIKKTQQTCIAS